MQVDHWMRQGDTLPPFSAVLRAGGVNVVGLPNGTTVALRLKSKALLDAGQSGLKVDAPGVLVTTTDQSGAPATKVQYNWLAADTDTPGVYFAEALVTLPDGDTETFPNAEDDPVVVVITPALS